MESFSRKVHFQRVMLLQIMPYRSKKAIIMQNHGHLTVGGSVEEACWWYVTMERSCQAQLLAEAAGTPRPIPEEMAAHTQKQVGSRQSGWFSAQPMFDVILAEQPDLLG